MALVLTALVVAACGGQAPTPNADLMADTTVGRNRCKPGKATERPFVVEWDATDFASFELKAARDTVFVKVDGCEMTVLDCRADISGKYGAYDTPQWTTGVVEGFEIKNEGDLYAKLPFGANSLAANVKGGNELQLKYFVSGSRPSLRSMIYRNDIASNPLCAGATHFVSGYDLGAFDLAQRGQSAEGADVKAGSAAAGGNLSHSEAHLKTAGSLADCTKENARELARCRVPIRLALRAIADGANPAPPTPTAAGVTGDMKDYQAASASAQRKAALRDGIGCLADLDRAASIQSESMANLDSTRAQCEMLSGRCEDGRRRYRAFLARTSPQLTPDQVDRFVVEQGVASCEGKESTPLEHAIRDQRGLIDALHAQDGAKCTTLGADLADAWSSLPANVDHQTRSQSSMALKYGADCIAKFNGDCATGKKLWPLYVGDAYTTSSDASRQAILASYQCPAGTGITAGVTGGAAATPTTPPKKKKKKPAPPPPSN